MIQESNGNGCALNCEASEKSDIILAFIRIIKEVMNLNSVQEESGGLVGFRFKNSGRWLRAVG